MRRAVKKQSETANFSQGLKIVIQINMIWFDYKIYNTKFVYFQAFVLLRTYYDDMRKHIYTAVLTN